MAAKLSLICPTIGRSTLDRLVQSVLPQMQDGDELIVVGDGPQPRAKAIVDQYPQVIYDELPVRVGDFGCTPCDHGIAKATGDVVFFIGDDDICALGAFDAIRAAVDAAPDVPHVFAMMHTGRKLTMTIACCNVSGQQIVVPRDMTRMPKMGEFPPQHLPVSDWYFISRVHEAWAGRTMFHDVVIAVLEAMHQGGML
jgi:hypothetical protein